MSETDFRPLQTGDPFDDDAQVIDDLVQPQANPVPPLPDEMTTPDTARPERITRMQTGRITLQSGWDPFQALPPDPFRKSLQIAMDSAAATDAIYMASSSDDARNGGSLFQANPISPAGHTGAVWLYNPTANPVNVSWWAVTL